MILLVEPPHGKSPYKFDGHSSCCSGDHVSSCLRRRFQMLSKGHYLKSTWLESTRHIILITPILSHSLKEVISEKFEITFANPSKNAVEKNEEKKMAITYPGQTEYIT